MKLKKGSPIWTWNSVRYPKGDFFKNIWYNIKWSVQRVKRGYCDRDWFSIDCWFRDVMEGMLCDLYENTHGYPYDMTYEEWKDLLAHMIFLLREMDEDKCSKQNPIDFYDMLKSEKGSKLREKYYENEEELSAYRDECKNEFLDLFKEHFHELWD